MQRKRTQLSFHFLCENEEETARVEEGEAEGGASRGEEGRGEEKEGEEEDGKTERDGGEEGHR